MIMAGEGGPVRVFYERWWRVCSDVAILFVLGALATFLELGGERGLYVDRGFFCNDESIRYPYTRHPAVPMWLLVVGSFFIPTISMLLGNLYERYYKKRPDCARKRVTLCRKSLTIPPWLSRMLYHLRWFLIGCLLTVVLTDVCKVTIGRLRPHFISICKPNFTQFNCTDSLGYPVYVTDFRCTGDDEKEIHDSHLSFPSGHSSFSTYSFVFLLLYLASVRTFYHRSALKLFLMVASFVLAVLTSVSRISDHRHHPTDVLAGMLIGAGVAVVIVYYFLSFFGHFKQVASDKQGVSDKESPKIPTSYGSANTYR